MSFIRVAPLACLVVLLGAPAAVASTTTAERTIQDCDGDNLLEAAPGERHVTFGSPFTDQGCADTGGRTPQLPQSAPDADMVTQAARGLKFVQRHEGSRRWRLALESERASDTIKAVVVTNKKLENVTDEPRLSADVENTTVAPMRNLSFIATIFDPQGNAFASSATSFDTS